MVWARDGIHKITKLSGERCDIFQRRYLNVLGAQLMPYTKSVNDKKMGLFILDCFQGSDMYIIFSSMFVILSDLASADGHRVGLSGNS